MRSTIVGAVALAGAVALSACAGNTGTGAAAPAPSSGTNASSSGTSASPFGTSASSFGTAASSFGAAPATSPAPATTAAAAAATKSPAVAATRTSAKPTPAAAGKSDVSQLKSFGITLDKGVLIDVADDGANHWLRIGQNGVVDFTGTTRTDSTMMALKAAPGGGKNRVIIAPPFWNEDLGTGSCVADTPGAPLKLETCRTGEATQIWTVVPAGDSGQFELRGKYGTLRVDGVKITTGDAGRSGLQTVVFAE